MKDDSFDFDTVYARLLSEFDIKTQQQLGEKLGMSASAVNSAKLRGVIPSRWFVELVTRYWLNPDWVRYGDIYPKYLKATSEVPDAISGSGREADLV